MTLLITVFGIVQGVGYRPFVARLAEELSVAGHILNCGGIVQITASSPSPETLERFVQRLRAERPMGAQVLSVKTRPLPDASFDGFRILPSVPIPDDSDSQDSSDSSSSQDILPAPPLLPADLPMCETCKEELYDPADRRYRYPFISCVACGPRYSIIKSIPYDRETVTMDVFPMCPSCESEYTENLNRRRHAQTISCHDCGPQLIFLCGGETFEKEAALTKAATLLQQGKAIALKGIGGYQLACLPTDEDAAQALRRFKRRDGKPFAVMFPQMQSVKEFCDVSPEEEALLQTAARPIVLLRKRAGRDFCFSVCGESLSIGAFLPYTPLHQLLTDLCGPLVMTSANLTSDPIFYRDEEMLGVPADDLAGVLYNERRIVTPLDDSVAQVLPVDAGRKDQSRVQLIRRSRGYVPAPILLNQKTRRAVLAGGGDLKSCFCLYSGDRAYLSQYFGDMENPSALNRYGENLKRMQTLFAIRPEIIACDLHPRYFTAAVAEKLSAEFSVPLVRIQHNHAHAASVMAEHGLDSCIGVVFDGTGFGTDGAVWGGEFLLCAGKTFERCAHLRYVTLCGGDRAAISARLAARCYRIAEEAETAGAKPGRAAGNAPEDSPNPPAPKALQTPDDSSEMDLLRAAIRLGVNTARSSSMGRLFDAAASILDIRHENTFEAECAIALETCATKFEESLAESSGFAKLPDFGVKWEELSFPIVFGETEIAVDQIGFFCTLHAAAKKIAAASETDRENLRGALAYAFHKAVARMVAEVCSDIRIKTGESRVALCGGVFANRLLLRLCASELERADFRIYLNSEVPCNDGGICLGQAFLCGE